jgi:hypothetical protein
MKVECITTRYTEETGFKGFTRVMEKSEINGVTQTKFIALRVPKGTPHMRIIGNYVAGETLFQDEAIKENCYLYINGAVYRLHADDGKIAKAKNSTTSVNILKAFAESLKSLDHAWDQLRSKGAFFRKDFSGRGTYLDVDGKLFPAHCSETFDLLFATKAIAKNGKITKRKFPTIALGLKMSYVISLLKALTSAGVVK